MLRAIFKEGFVSTYDFLPIYVLVKDRGGPNSRSVGFSYCFLLADVQWRGGVSRSILQTKETRVNKSFREKNLVEQKTKWRRPRQWRHYKARGGAPDQDVTLSFLCFETEAG